MDKHYPRWKYPTLLTLIYTIGFFSFPAAAEQPKINTFKSALEIVTALAPGHKQAFPTRDTRGIDLDIRFKLNSWKLSNGAQRQLKALGTALQNKKFVQNNITIAGHTDATGSAGHNIRLSRKRAQTVLRYLVAHYNFKEEKFSIIGYGESMLKDIFNPRGEINRRVEILVEQRGAAQTTMGKIKW